jgi:hypothetical protein
MSESRQCLYALATDGQWYLQIGDHEHCWDDWNCTWYGPFPSLEVADEYTYNNFTNTGGSEIDDRGTMEPPKEFTRPRL